MSLRGERYLAIPSSCGFWWSPSRDAIHNRSGGSFTVFEELELILGGVFASPPVPPFVDVLRVLHAMRADPHAENEYARLLEAYRRNKSAESVTRHLGLLIAELCRELPPALDPPDWPDLQITMYRLGSINPKRQPVATPTHTPAEFNEIVLRRLGQFDDPALDRFLKSGTRPTEADERLVEEIDDLPRTVAKVLELARKRPRLVGITVLAPLFDAAMTLPARSRSAEALPLGGYADVTTRGDPDRLLLSQFALDPDDFVRRFAERELLYFKREEPHAPIPPTRVIVLDQGVRTWGPIRLALAAAALALLKRNPAKSPRPALYRTSHHQPLPLEPADAEEWAKALEASDLTTTPASRLADVCAQEFETPRDLLLLTHPRSAADASVIDAAAKRRPMDRLFVLAVEDDGASVLSEWTPRGPMVVRSFRVDLEAADRAEAEVDATGKPTKPTLDYQPWTGDVEPVPFPFRPGLLDTPEHLGFDAAGERLLIVTRGGIPHLTSADGSTLEILPRAVHHGTVLKNVHTLLPVMGGIVVCGSMWTVTKSFVEVAATNAFSIIASGHFPSDPATHQGSAGIHALIAVHYDFESRTVRLFNFGEIEKITEWRSYPEDHTIVLHTGTKQCPLALDLATEKRYPHFELTSRAMAARGCELSEGCGPWRIPNSESKQSKIHTLNVIRNSVKVYGLGEWKLFTPIEDGKPLLTAAKLESALLSDDVLALQLSKDQKSHLHLFRGPEPMSLGIVPLYGLTNLYILSPDGRRLAWLRGKGEIAVAETARPGHVLAVHRHASLHGDFKVSCQSSPFHMRVRVGNFQHDFAVDRNRLDYVFTREPDPGRGNGMSERTTQFTMTGYDKHRFSTFLDLVTKSFWVLKDRHGQIALLNAAHDVVLLILIRREKCAVWTPRGGFWGDAELIGGAPTPGAAAAIVSALNSEVGDSTW